MKFKFLTLFVFAVALFSCQEKKSPILNKWTFEEVVFTGGNTNAGDSLQVVLLEMMNTSLAGSAYQFNADSTYSFLIREKTEAGKFSWNAKDSVLVLKVNKNGSTKEKKFDVKKLDEGCFYLGVGGMDVEARYVVGK
jgi:hypothetical protein